MRGLLLSITGMIAACAGAPSAPPMPPPSPTPTPVESAPQPAAAAEPPAEDSDGEQGIAAAPPIVARNFTLSPGKRVEVMVDCEGGAVVKASFRGDGSVDWAVESERGGVPRKHDSGRGTDGRVAFAPSEPGAYAFGWRNNGKRPVSLIVSIELTTGAAIRSWYQDSE